MTRAAITVTALLASIVIGFAIGRNWNPASGPVNQPAAENEREILYWVAPMDPDYRRDAPGKSPMGMDLVPVYATDSGPGVVSIDPLIVSNLGVRTDVAQSGILQRQIETVGYVGYDEDTLQHIHTRVDGWLEQLSVTATGDAVERGQVLFELYSPTLVNAQEEYLAALQSRNTALHEASRERLAALGMTTAEIERLNKQRKVEQRVRVYAERDGVVAHLGVREGIYVTPATNVMSVADLDRVWILAEVFERQAAWVKPGHEAVVELDYLPGKLLYGTVDYVYPELDPQTRTLKVRLRFDNETDELRPNMFARVTIRGDDTGEVVHVPREALIRGGTVDRVVMALGDGHFRAQPVEIGIESGGRVAISSGVSAGDRIVTSGQFLIDSESNIEAALSRMQGVSDEPVNETGNRSEPER
ncbi:MAG: efflux RND transporter periplasmic adaptor subunit [Woeseiaceae bacterium]|jgi:Cu(I)/Ag(I) efflux system membrane fusion protein